MNTMFWVLWFFIAIVVVVVAFLSEKKMKRCREGTSLEL